VRPVRLEMAAFGPYAGTQVLDFRDLRDNTFFLITGPTGAGKTSVLDAMCFALYGDTTGHERKGAEMRSQFAHPDVPTRVQLDFSIGGELYRVERAPAQERPALNRPEQTVIHPTTATLWRRTGAASDAASGEVLASRPTDATKRVQELLGFSVEQFRQVVMLPQGRFRDLLSADSRTRQGILEQLFNAALYGEFEGFLKERKKRLKATLDGLASRTEELLASLGVTQAAELDARLAEAQAARARAGAAADAARGAADVATAALHEGREMSRLLGEADDSRRECNRALEALEAAQAAALLAAADLAGAQGQEGEREALAEELRRLDALAGRAGELEDARCALEAAERALGGRKEEVEAACARLAEAGRSVQSASAEAEAVRASAAGLSAAEAACRDAARVAEALERLRRVRAAAVLAEKEGIACSAAVESAAVSAAEARRDLAQLDDLWRMSRAAALAGALREGEPCPVCGSTAHPAPVAAAGEIPSDDLLAAARARLEMADGALRQQEKRYSAARASLADAAAAQREIECGLGVEVEHDPPAAAAEAARLEEELARLRAEAHGLQALEEGLQTARAAEAGLHSVVAEANARLGAAEEAGSRAASALAEKQAAVPEQYRDPGRLQAARAEAAQRREMLVRLLDSADTADRAAREALAAAQAVEQGARERAAVACAAVDGLEAPDLGALAAAAASAAATRDEAARTQGGHSKEAERLGLGRQRAAELLRESETVEEQYRVVGLLSDVASGANGRAVSFQRYVLAVFLEEVLASASRRLLEMTGSRFQLHAAGGAQDRRKAGGLDLEVFDEFTGEDRAVGTLSGGEGFLASLAMALGLAEVVQDFTGGIRLEAVFIDEGFGSLDPEALDAAIDTLLDLREHGRLVGIISHVPELRERIDCRLEVTSARNGSTAAFVVP
jgi:DNA repair protein SbcC/Rad50